MRYVLLCHDAEIIEAFRSPEAFLPNDELIVVDSKESLVEACAGADLVFVDLVATLDEPHKIAGYERLYDLKSADPVASAVPLVLIAPPAGYDLDFMVGWPDFVFAQMPRPVTSKLFRRASTWI